MKYAKRRKEYTVNYESNLYQPCWTCQNACGGCSWSRSFKPVEGWTAEKTFLQSNGEYAESYKIIKCPEYIKDKR